MGDVNLIAQWDLILDPRIVHLAIPDMHGRAGDFGDLRSNPTVHLAREGKPWIGNLIFDPEVPLHLEL